ncbi:MAG: hypothetical protein JW941_03640 [Candidatus Coatesbacteria bacterium]|nr:hypothetical protein [Candidatus Coatesbacteria bacterium]
MKLTPYISVLFSLRFILPLIAALLMLAPAQTLAIVGPAADDRLEDAATLYSRVEELWRARAAGDSAKAASLVTTSSKERLDDGTSTPLMGGSASPVIASFRVESVTIGSAGKVAVADIDFTISIPGAPVRIPQKQTEIWEKIDSVWLYKELVPAEHRFDVPVTTSVHDSPVTGVVRPGEGNLAIDVSERFDRFRIASYWVSKAIPILNSNREESIHLLNGAIRIGAPPVWERLIEVDKLIDTNVWEDLIPKAKADILDLVKILEKLGRSKEALRVIESQLELTSNDLQLLEMQGDLLRGQGEIESAVSIYQKAVSAATTSDKMYEVYRKLGESYFELRRFDDAASNLALAAAIDPMAETLKSVLSLLADSLYAGKDYKHALHVYRVVNSFAPPSVEAIRGRLRAAVKADDLEDALQVSLKAHTANGAIRDEVLDAWSKLKKHIKRIGKSAANYYTMGVLAESLGETKDARQAFEKALDDQPSHFGSLAHLYAIDGPSEEMRQKHGNQIASLMDTFGLADENELQLLAKSLSRSPDPTASVGPLHAHAMRQLYSGGVFSRAILVASGIEHSREIGGAETIECGDGAILALDIAETGCYFLFFDAKPVSLQSQFDPTLAILLDGETLEISPLTGHNRRYGKAVQLTAGIHSLQFSYNLFSPGTPRPGDGNSPPNRFLLAHLGISPISKYAGAGESTGNNSPVDIVSLSVGGFLYPEGDIFVDGTQLSTQLSGYNVIAVDRETGSVIDSLNFRTSDDRNAESKFKAFNTTLKPGTLLAVAVLEDGTYRADKLINECIEAAGAKDVLVRDYSWADEIMATSGIDSVQTGKGTRGMLFPARFRHSYALVGAIGAEPGRSVEATGWDRSIAAITTDGEKTRAFLKALSPCEQRNWAESAKALTSFFETGNKSFVKRLPFGDKAFVEFVLPEIESTDPALFQSMGRRLEECHMNNEALMAYDRGLAVAENASTYFAKALLLGKMHNYGASRKAYLQGATVSPVPKLWRLKDIAKDVDGAAIETIFAGASNGVSFQYLNGVRTAIGENAWTLAGIDPESGELIDSKTMSREDPTALARAIDSFPKGSIIVLTFAGYHPVEIEVVLANAIQECIRREALPNKTYLNLVLIGYRTEKPMAFYNGSYDEASLMASWE